MSHRRDSGRRLNQLYGAGAKQALYHWEGTFYENLREFPGALFDQSGYVVFETEAEYRKTPGLKIGKKLNVRGGISGLLGYVLLKAR